MLLPVSIHAPREGCDWQYPIPRRQGGGFNSRTPGGVRQGRGYLFRVYALVSIHAPREGCDLYRVLCVSLTRVFQFTHPGRGATPPPPPSTASSKFQFTHPGRGATQHVLSVLSSLLSFNSRTPGGVRRGGHVGEYHFDHVSIHAPREGCDLYSLPLFHIRSAFQFTHPGRGATPCQKAQTGQLPCFNSRTPGGVRRVYARVYRAQLMFQFTHPGRGATYLTKKDEFGRRVSIHAPREGCDQAGNAAINAYMQFQFTHPGRGATACWRSRF